MLETGTLGQGIYATVSRLLNLTEGGLTQGATLTFGARRARRIAKKKRRTTHRSLELLDWGNTLEWALMGEVIRKHTPREKGVKR